MMQRLHRIHGCEILLWAHRVHAGTSILVDLATMTCLTRETCLFKFGWVNDWRLLAGLQHLPPPRGTRDPEHLAILLQHWM